MKSIYEKLRVLVTILTVSVLGAMFLFGKNHWEKDYEFICSLLFSLGILLVGIASLGRLWCSLYIAGYKTTKLVQAGPYSLCRNPLYLFSFIGAMGAGMVTEMFIFPAVLALLFFCYYPAIIFSEERRLAEIHGESFEAYKKAVPRVLPKLSNLAEPTEYTVNPVVFRKHIFSALWFIWIVGIIEIIEELHALNLLPSLWELF